MEPKLQESFLQHEMRTERKQIAEMLGLAFLTYLCHFFSILLFVSAFLNGNNYPFPTWRLHGLDSMTRGPAGTSAWCIKMGSAVEVSPCLPFWSALHGFLFVSPKSRYYRLCYPTPTTRSVGCLEHQTFQVFPEPIRLEIDSWCHEAECSHSIHIFFIGSHLVMESTLAVCFRSIYSPRMPHFTTHV